jgi:hypothetical protein
VSKTRKSKFFAFTPTDCQRLIAQHGIGVELWNRFYEIVDERASAGIDPDFLIKCEGLLEQEWKRVLAKSSLSSQDDLAS